MKKGALYLIFVGLLFLASFSAVLAQIVSQGDELTAQPGGTTSDTTTVAPVIIISQPSVKEVVKVDTITVYGTIKSAEKMERLVLTVNGERDFPVEGIESWKARVTLTRGANEIVVRAIDIDGNAVAKAAVTVYYVPPEVVASLAEKEVPELLKREIIKKKIIQSRLTDIARLENDRYLIDRESAQLEKAAIEIRLRRLEEGTAPIEDAGGRDILVEEYTEVDSDMTSDEKSGVGLSTDEELLSTFVRVESNLTDIDWAIVKIEFTDEEIRLKRLAREKLFMVWYDDNEGSPTFGRWVRLRKGHPVWVHGVGINKTGRYVWANVSHFSVYGIGGQIATSPETQPPTTPPPETMPPTETSQPTQTQAPPAETQPPTHFPKETPRPTVTTSPSTPTQIIESSVSEKTLALSRRVRKGRLLILFLVILLFAALWATGRKKEQPTEEAPREDAEKDLLAEEETPTDDYPDN